MNIDFKTNANLNNWVTINDVVMGGKSSSQFKKEANNFGVFQGHVSLDNNGGFSSLRYQFEKIKVSNSQKIKIRLKGDGKNYQFRIKNNINNNFAYTTSFSTTKEWQVIEILLKDMYPVFRGKKLNYPNFSNDTIEQILFLIANKKDEHFKLLIDSIELI